MRAEVRDALWMLTKQWQMGEFRGSDAGSPVFAKLLLATTRLTKYRPAGGAAQLFDASIPLETKVERRPVPTAPATAHPRARPAPGHGAPVVRAHRRRGRLPRRLHDGLPDRETGSHAEPGRRCVLPSRGLGHLCRRCAGRAMDGGALLEYLLADPTHHAYDGIATIASTDHARARRPRAAISGMGRTIPDAAASATDDAWVPDHLDYQFAASAPLPDGTEKVYVADDYASARLDWYSLDLDHSIATLGNVAWLGDDRPSADAPFTTIPIPVSFSGMPNTRWWAFEDHATNFGDIDASTTDLAKLLVHGVRARLLQRLVRHSLHPAVGRAGATCRGWQSRTYSASAFGLKRPTRARTTRGAVGACSPSTSQRSGGRQLGGHDPALAANLASAQSGPTQEEVFLVRDEVADMAWGVEKTVPWPAASAGPGSEVGKQTFNLPSGA